MRDNTAYYDVPADALEALVLGFQGQNLGKTLFINAYPHSALGGLDLKAQQYFKPYADLLTAQGYEVLEDMPEEKDVYDSVLILMPKNKIEARYFLAKGIAALKQGGQILCAAGNKEGGKGLKKMLQQFGFSKIDEQSKNKCRVVISSKDKIDQNALSQALSEGSMQSIIDGNYLSQPGVFGWEKVDKGSEILLQYLPKALEGKGADFGCGYGYLSVFLLQHFADIKSLICIDADARAVEVSRHNLKNDDRCQFLWANLTQPQSALKSLDFIVMNPPFHEGKKTNIDIGKSFISNAHSALKTDGRLYMVANAHLPYEALLQEKFQDVQKLYEGEGFKVFCAAK